MKKTLVATALLFIGLANVNAQNFELGAKAGINFASIVGDNTSDVGPITEFQSFGLVSEIPLSKKFSFQPEVMYSVQGFDNDDELVNLNYLNVPLMAKYYVAKGFSLEAGPQLGYLLSAKQDDNDVDENFKSFDLGLNLGVGYKLENGLNFGARANLGLSNINDIELDGVDNTNRNAVFQVYVGLFFL